MATPTRSDSSPDDDPWTVLFDQFNRTVRSESESLLKHIVDSQTNLLNERNCLRSEIESLRKEKKELAEMCKQYGQVVTLNVGGQMFSSTLETLTEEPCLFTKMFSGRHELPEHQGAVFVDRDPTHFRVLLNYLRTRTFIEPKSPEIRAELRLEAEYYQIASLVRHLAYQSDPTTVAERLFFGVDLHHPAVSIAADMLQASYRGPCAKFIYAGVANLAWHSGRHYWEVIFEGNKSCYASVGVATSSWSPKRRLGSDCFSWTMRICDGAIDLLHTGLRHNDRSVVYHNRFPFGSRIGVLLDLNEGTLEYVLDGVRLGVAFNNLKARTVAPVFEFCHGTAFQMNHDALVPSVERCPVQDSTQQ